MMTKARGSSNTNAKRAGLAAHVPELERGVSQGSRVVEGSASRRSYLAAGATSFIYTAPWLVNFPGLASFLAVLGFNLFGNALRDTLDPALREG